MNLSGLPLPGAIDAATALLGKAGHVQRLRRLAIDVGGATRYATYASGTGTAVLIFSYTVQTGDFDGNGIALVSPLQLNGGTLIDGVGNPATDLAFTLPDTSALKVQTYTASFTTSPITNANANAVSFAIAKAPAGLHVFAVERGAACIERGLHDQGREAVGQHGDKLNLRRHIRRHPDLARDGRLRQLQRV